MTTSEKTNSTQKKKRARKVRPYPVSTFNDALSFAQAIQKNSGNQPIRRLTLFDAIKKAPESGPSRTLVTNASKYGLIKGGPASDYIELTDLGFKATSEDVSEYDRTKARIESGISNIEIFKFLHDKFKGNKLPIHSVLHDAARDLGSDADDIEMLVDNFIVNCEELGLLKTLSGAQRIIEIDHALDGLPKNTGTVSNNVDIVNYSSHGKTLSALTTSGNSNLDMVCFYVTPIGSDDSEHRKHSDLFLGSIIEPAIEPLGLKVVRADKIDQPGMITNQVIEYIFRAKLVIVDLSFSNPNVFYELALRHASRLPTVQIIRKGDSIPFDISQFRTLVLDCTDIYTLVPKLETYKSEITSQARSALAEAGTQENPITSVYPSLRLEI